MELRMLRRGMEGNDVRAAMLLMKDKGYYPDAVSYTHLDVYKRQGAQIDAKRETDKRIESTRQEISERVDESSSQVIQATHQQITCLLYTSLRPIHSRLVGCGRGADLSHV